MTLAEYMSPERFPLTTQKGLPPDKQMLIDSVNYDDLAEYEEDGRAMTDEQKALWAELKDKFAARDDVVAEMRAAANRKVAG